MTALYDKLTWLYEKLTALYEVKLTGLYEKLTALYEVKLTGLYEKLTALYETYSLHATLTFTPPKRVGHTGWVEGVRRLPWTSPPTYTDLADLASLPGNPIS